MGGGGRREGGGWRCLTDGIGASLPPLSLPRRIPSPQSGVCDLLPTPARASLRPSCPGSRLLGPRLRNAAEGVPMAMETLVR